MWGARGGGPCEGEGDDADEDAMTAGHSMDAVKELTFISIVAALLSQGISLARPRQKLRIGWQWRRLFSCDECRGNPGRETPWLSLGLENAPQEATSRGQEPLIQRRRSEESSGNFAVRRAETSRSRRTNVW